MKKLKVIDFMLGDVGFSEGFRQIGYYNVHGYDQLKLAVGTCNYNFKLKCNPESIKDFQNTIEEIENLRCVGFSSSKKSTNADKSLGAELTKTFLRIDTVKKHQPNTALNATFMENKVNSKKYLQTIYTFKYLVCPLKNFTHYMQSIKILSIAIEN